MRSLDAHFAHQGNTPFEKHQFRQAKQGESETADQFVLRLFQLSENCEFGEAKEEHIRGQLIDKCRSHNLRKKLLEVSGTLTLQNARAIARSTEAAESQARFIENDSKGDSVHALEDKQADYSTRKRGNCYQCGLEGHFARDSECKARSVTCQKCKKTGHHTKFCRTKGEDKTKKRNVCHVTEDDDFAFTVQLGARGIPTVAIELGGVQLEGVVVDSGSTAMSLTGRRRSCSKRRK